MGVQQRHPIGEARLRTADPTGQPKRLQLAVVRLRTKEEKLAQMLATVKDIDGVKHSKHFCLFLLGALRGF